MSETSYTNLDLGNILGVQAQMTNNSRNVNRQVEINKWFLRLFDKRSDDLFSGKVTVDELIAMSAQIVDGLNKA